MKKFAVLLGLGVAFLLTKPTLAQTKPATKAAPTASAAPVASATAAVEKPAEPAGSPSLITDKMEAPASASDALKVSVETNPVTKRLIVKTNSAGPTRLEVNDDEGRPVLTENMITGTKPTVLDVSRLPAGYYIVQCTAGERRGMRRVMLGQ